MITNPKIFKPSTATIYLLALALFAYILFYFLYFIAEKRAQKTRFNQWYNSSYKPSGFKGVIFDISDDGLKTNRCDSIIRIVTAEKKMISYNLSFCADSSFSNFIEVGDTIIKEPNKVSVIIIKNNIVKSFSLPFYRGEE